MKFNKPDGLTGADAAERWFKAVDSDSMNMRDERQWLIGLALLGSKLFAEIESSALAIKSDAFPENRSIRPITRDDRNLPEGWAVGAAQALMNDIRDSAENVGGDEWLELLEAIVDEVQLELNTAKELKRRGSSGGR